MFLNNTRKLIALGAVLFSSLTVAWSQVTVLTFEGISDASEVGNYYNGGAGGDHGISFGAGSLALVSSLAGGGGNFDGGSSGSTILYFVSSNSAVMNVAGGFIDGVSFYYAAFSEGSVTVYSELNATGDVLATFHLPQSVFGDRVTSWEAIGVQFDGVARSVSFGGSANQIGFDDITIGSHFAGGPAVPEPSTYALILGAGALVGVWVSRRRSAA